ncbi:Gti1/Pac2 family-domain-containing protein [Mycotypha africana]|uniref:Gti1/Pac2 family-domain-containing protein n=1 Tax=Mycotypha africana TaxID=64632 RepID=UPI002301A6FC|nr:Gti1/Pac2 family-domain-containing protein [Mycotypha africana]KAI8971653.1 Gti1/Pac2 family-domain-containing protein [Mycotypha africana]
MMPIDQTFDGFIETTTDALLIFEACRRGILPKISRRLQDKERSIIRSGAVFVFDEKESGIKRWTDGLVWSPSRILGNFLIYRELDGRETAQQKSNQLNTMADSKQIPTGSAVFSEPQQLCRSLTDTYYTGSNIHQVNAVTKITENRSRERNLVGSLTDSYKFRRGGLIKKTISVHLNGSTQHLVSYYNKTDVVECQLATPSVVHELSALQISPDLLLKQSFRVPPSVEFAELIIKRPSLSPSSTNSTITCCSTTPVSSRRVSNTNDNLSSLPYLPETYDFHHHPANRYPLSMNYFQTTSSTEELGLNYLAMHNKETDGNECIRGRTSTSFAILSNNKFENNVVVNPPHSLSGNCISLSHNNMQQKASNGAPQPYKSQKLTFSMPPSSVYEEDPGHSNTNAHSPLAFTSYAMSSSSSNYEINRLHQQQQRESSYLHAVSSANADQLFEANDGNLPENTCTTPVAQYRATKDDPSFSRRNQTYGMECSVSAQHLPSVSTTSSVPIISSNVPLWYTPQPYQTETTTVPYA